MKLFHLIERYFRKTTRQPRLLTTNLPEGFGRLICSILYLKGKLHSKTSAGNRNWFDNRPSSYGKLSKCRKIFPLYENFFFLNWVVHEVLVIFLSDRKKVFSSSKGLRGFYPPPLISGPTTNKKKFYVRLPLVVQLARYAYFIFLCVS